MSVWEDRLAEAFHARAAARDRRKRKLRAGTALAAALAAVALLLVVSRLDLSPEAPEVTATVVAGRLRLRAAVPATRRAELRVYAADLLVVRCAPDLRSSPTCRRDGDAIVADLAPTAAPLRYVLAIDAF